jgi:UDP-N-acetylmuramate: L-alanyl-gamma-D-glutamyl-meso-diaminopimelate ligase
VEGDEYDTAFFDKGPKFLHYRPQIAILTSVEFDHADIYADFAAVKSSFRRLAKIMPEKGALVACYDDPVVREIAGDARCEVLSYGQDPGFDWALADLRVEPGGTTFTVLCRGKRYGTFKSTMPGRHNALNSLAVIAVLDRIGLEPEEIQNGLAGFQGVRRRQEVRGTVRGITVIDDFAHHPTAVRETLASLAEAYAGRRLIAVFEPRTNSSRRRVFQDAYVSSFSPAARVLIREPLPLLHLPPEERFSSSQLVQDLRARGIDALYFPSTDAILDFLARESLAGDVIAIMSNGGFDNIHQRLLALFSESD